MSHATPEELAKKIAAEANTCCYRSDGYEERIKALALSVINEAVAAERERCAKIAYGAQLLPNDQDLFANGWCSAALQIAQAIRAASAQHLDTSPAICDNPST